MLPESLWNSGLAPCSSRVQQSRLLRMHPVGFGISPQMETPQPLWVTSGSVGTPVLESNVWVVSVPAAPCPASGFCAGAPSLRVCVVLLADFGSQSYTRHHVGIFLSCYKWSDTLFIKFCILCITFFFISSICLDFWTPRCNSQYSFLIQIFFKRPLETPYFEI